MSTRDDFIARNLPLVHSLANRFRGRGIDYEELFAAGSLGLVKACDKFDESRGLCFSTYAVPVILGEIRRLFRDGGSVKMSRSLKELSVKAARAREELSKSGNEPTITEIAEYLGVSPEDAAEAVAASAPTMSLTCSDDDGGSFDVPVDSGESALIDRLALQQCLDELSEEDRKLIILRYFRNMTQSQTAQALGMSQVQISRRERKILEGLRLQLI
ncbi:MAG: sigma-70 family RNA polymerase sigma factor [Ruminococcaceae bacterium]|nr:sigma-70 family RNA polymerase sigma factor [Oscillospiraceae bacterium]